jgi:glutathione synthase/RimK-type ligase-like ATP-grasp enzyme
MESGGQRIGIATCARHASLEADDLLLQEALTGLGIEAPALVWDDEGADWSAFDACLLRSTWDYHDKHDEFLAWTQSVSAKTQLWNPPDLVAWNSNKTYLRELEEVGVPTVPTVWLTPGDEEDLGALLESRGWDELVVKPAIDLGARNLKRAQGPKQGAGALRKVLRRGEAMLQPYLPSIETSGELSLVYIDGALAHTVRKLPAPGDFRVQEIWGGTRTPVDPSAEELAIGDLVLNQVPEPPLYARIDLVDDLVGQPCLIELELIEPNLYMTEAPATANLLAQAIAKRLGL